MYPTYIKHSVKDLILLILLIISTSHAQIDTLWTRTFGGNDDEEGYSAQQSNDGGYIITGYTKSFGAGGSDVWLIKTDTNADTLWTKTYGGSNDDMGFSVQQTLDEGYIITGYTESYGAGYKDLWLIKTDSHGDTLWTKSYGGIGDDWGYSVQQTLDEGYIVTGTKDTSDVICIPYCISIYERDLWLLKININGDTLWTKTFGGTKLEVGNSVQQTLDEGYIITGFTDTFGFGNGDVWLIKTNADGDTLWSKTIGGYDEEHGQSVQQTKDGGYIVTGYRGIQGIIYVLLIKTTTDGDTLWTKTYGRIGDDWGYDYGLSVQQTKDKGYFIIGCTGGYVWLIKTNANGDTLWTKTYVYGSVYSGRQTEDEGYIITGFASSNNSAANVDIWLMKTTPYIDQINNNSIIIPSEYNLSQNFPNPFNPKTTIQYSIPKPDQVTICIYTISGQIIESKSRNLNPGSYSYEFDGSLYSTGIYIYRISTLSGFSAEHKMLLLK